MADWITMQCDLLNHPRLIAMADRLGRHPEFSAWVLTDASRLAKDVLSCAALRSVALARCHAFWSASRRWGKFVGADLILHPAGLDTVDTYAGAPGVGEALAAVGWIRVDAEAVILRNFMEHNRPRTAKSAAERMRAVRERKRNAVAQQDDEKPLRVARNGCATVAPHKGKERTEHKGDTPLNPQEDGDGFSLGEPTKPKSAKPPKPPKPTAADVEIPAALNTAEFRNAWLEWIRERIDRKKPLTPRAAREQLEDLEKVGATAAVAAIRRSIASGWSGVFPETNGRNQQQRDPLSPNLKAPTDVVPI